MIKSLAYQVAAFASLPRLLQQAFAPGSAAVLMYHAVTASPLAVEDWCFIEERSFRAQMHYLKKHCRVVPLRELPQAIASRPTRPIVALTFDDGFRNNFSVAFPVLSALALPATIFLATDFIGSEDTLWFCRINAALTRTALTRLDWDGESYDLSDAAARARAHARFQVRLKQFPHPELLTRTAQLIKALGDTPDRPVPHDSPYRMLAAQEVRQMADSELIDFGGHTCSHAILSGLGAAQRSREVLTSMANVERLTAKPCTLFAYPNGRLIDYGPCDLETLRGRHTQLAVTTVTGPNDAAVPPLELRRYMVGPGTSAAQFKLLTHHVLWKLQTLAAAG
jgi:peptidoglycan/xylan/chitin deacetylase (PgdA/CDA1 family)